MGLKQDVLLPVEGSAARLLGGRRGERRRCRCRGGRTVAAQEGELRPQLLDRFGLSVNVKTLQDKAQRTQLVLDRLAYETDPDAFVESARPAQVSRRRRSHVGHEPRGRHSDAALQ